MGDNDEDTTVSRQEETRLKAERKSRRKKYKKALKGWENTWWNDIINETKTAAEKGDWGTVYKALKKT